MVGGGVNADGLARVRAVAVASGRARAFVSRATFVHMRALLLCLMLFPAMSLADSKTEPNCVVSTANEPWCVRPMVARPRTAVAADAVVIDLGAAVPGQPVAGFGGCFNEQGWEVLSLLEPQARDAVLRALFDVREGCGFTLCRMPMGANDYSLAWYSYDEVPGDLQLEHFSIERDTKYLIPFIRAARSIAPGLQVWASPWCPPAWMKTNAHYACAVAPVNDLRPEQAGQEMVTQFRMEPPVLDSYARYFGKFIDAYAAVGIPIVAVHVQNEPNSCQNFPSCVWRPEDLATFIGAYLGPRFRAEGRATQIWLGTVERPQIERVAAVLDSPAREFIAGVGFQWAGKGAIPLVRERYPHMRLMQTETECGDGSNDWAAAEHTWSLMRHYFEHGAEAYMYWNFVLDETGNSRWGWRQNAMVTVDRQTRAVRYNPEYFLMRHLAAFVRPGARRLEVDMAGADGLVFANADGSIVLVAANRTDAPQALGVKIGDLVRVVDLPARAFVTASFPRD
jgi:glucosylceramidase